MNGRIKVITDYGMAVQMSTFSKIILVGDESMPQGNPDNIIKASFMMPSYEVSCAYHDGDAQAFKSLFMKHLFEDHTCKEFVSTLLKSILLTDVDITLYLNQMEYQMYYDCIHNLFSSYGIIIENQYTGQSFNILGDYLNFAYSLMYDTGVININELFMIYNTNIGELPDAIVPRLAREMGAFYSNETEYNDVKRMIVHNIHVLQNGSSFGKGV